MKVGLMVFTANNRYDYSKRPYDSIREVTREAESDGFDSVWLADHLLYRNPGEPTRGIWECWTVLSALAEATERVEIGTLVACSSFRNPAILAKMATTVDEVSHGRLILGVGAGWNQPEYEAFGLPFDHRVDRFEEALQILKPLLHDGHVDFNGRYYRATNCDDVPRGPRANGPPLMVGGEGPRMLTLTSKYADLWNTGYMGKPETMAEPLARIRAACRKTGRDPSTLGVTALVGLWFPDILPAKPSFFEDPLKGTVQEIASAMRGYADLGAQHIMFQCEPYTRETIRRLTEALRLYRESGQP
ncbi:MAG TPA: LLM class flavin-dependent oxidoreductase [Nitrososphaerales archaeon]|nr:LLM class flavin-dependent oxidoreductase [Nitrososphaerales archaeon]